MSKIEDLKRNGAFCAMPWLHFHITTTGASTPCCLSATGFTDEEGKSFNIRNNSIREIWDSSSYQALRDDMVSGVRNPACAHCYKNEDVSGASTRTKINEWLLENHFRAEQNTAIILDEIEGKSKPPIPGYVDIRLSNLCNLGCRMCCSDASSQIQNDPVHSQWSPYNGPQAQPGSNTAELNDSDSPVLTELKTFEGLYNIQLAGGEPTVNKAQVAWLTSLAQSGAAKNIDLSLWTNFTTSNRSIFNVIGEFRNIVMVLSLDGTGPTYDYIRWPGKWHMIERNLEYLAKFRSKIQLRLNCVVQAYNVDNVTDLCEWARINEIEVMLHHVTGCEYLDYRILSPGKQERIRASLSRYAKSMGLSKVDGTIRAAINEVLARTAEPFDETRRRSYLDAFIEMTNDLDRQRKQSLEASIPSIYGDIAGMHGGEWPRFGRFTEPRRQAAG